MNKIVTIARREALLSVLLAVLYMLAWWLSAYATPSHLTLGGWPLWFLLSCLFNPLLFVGLCVVMVRYCFNAVALSSKSLNTHNLAQHHSASNHSRQRDKLCGS
ncbi:YhdT family protein [Oceanisphaera pacifica]|uniref:YhdT family protein n=1 Tax=Oceanisphaera pacifica TaxID=2818389 RepID=A0ABS3NDQ9_9GAMM|nr:YhdT family protein [Oceanisphaera pacifica]MBO1518416.1 YhdT family protein [Oceanisphaera pacifica]